MDVPKSFERLESGPPSDMPVSAVVSVVMEYLYAHENFAALESSVGFRFSFPSGLNALASAYQHRLYQCSKFKHMFQKPGKFGCPDKCLFAHW